MEAIGKIDHLANHGNYEYTKVRNVMCKIVEGHGICVHEHCGDEEKYGFLA